MNRTNKATGFYVPSNGEHDVEIRNIYPKGDKNTRWEFAEMVDGEVKVFSVWLREFEENFMLEEIGIKPINGAYCWDDENIIGKKFKIETEMNGKFIQIKNAKYVGLKEDQDDPF